MPVLRLPNAILPRFVSFAWQYHRPPSLLYLLPRSREVGSRQTWMSRPLYHGHPKPVYSDGAVRVSQVPGESSRTSALLTRPRPRLSCHAISAQRFCPRNRDHEGHSNLKIFEAQSHSFSTRCLRFQFRLSLHWQDSLPAGGKPLPGGIRTHWTPSANFKTTSFTIYPNAPGFAWRHPMPFALCSSLFALRP